MNSSHFDWFPSSHVGRSFRITTGLTITLPKFVATKPISDMVVSVLVLVTTSWALTPPTLRSSASASICCAAVGLRGDVSLIEQFSFSYLLLRFMQSVFLGKNA
jgi:hypothetical protein